MEDKIREAYDRMDPTPEQEERMLANLLAQAESLDEPEAAQETNAPVIESVHTGQPQPKRNGLSAWKIALPVAACLVLVAVLVGVGSFGTSAPQPTVSEETRSHSAAKDEPSAESPVAVVEGDATEAEDGAMQLNGATTGEVAVEPEPDPYLEDPFNTEEYAAIDENGFVNTRTRPLSTVSADVDTASYCNVRRMINDGYSLSEIPKGAVRAEEMLNYFTYDYKTPTGDNLFSMQAEASVCPWNEDTQLLVIGFATPEEAQAASKGSNLVFLIDVSGSMDSPDKLDLLKESFEKLVENLDENDRVSIVTYSGTEKVVLEGASGDDHERILKAIKSLRANGSTNGEAGLRMAYDVAQSNFIEGGVNRIVMASDGDLNVGMTSTSDLYDFVEEKRETGVYLSVLGFGSGNYKDTKMETLADHGNGSYHYIDCVEEAERVLSDKLMANLVPFADDVKVQVEFNPAQVKAYRLIGYENREMPDEDFKNDEVDAGDVGPNAQFTVAYEIVLADSAYEVPEVTDLKYGRDDYAGSNSSDWLTCSLRYRAFSDDTVHEQELVVDKRNATANPSNDWEFASTVIEFAMLASDSNYVGTANLDDIINKLDGMKLNGERKGFLDLVELAHFGGGWIVDAER